MHDQQADSGFDARLYRQLAVAPTLLLDARSTPSAEHASTNEVAAWCDADLAGGNHAVWVTGYGTASESPARLASSLLQRGLAAAAPGTWVHLCNRAERVLFSDSSELRDSPTFSLAAG
jgi:hypothetical protein